jgi:glycine cleavage system H protein
MKEFTDTEEWFEQEGGVVTVGITRVLAAEVGDVVYVKLPLVGTLLEKEAEAAILESTKAALDTYAPVGGRVIAINQRVIEDPSIINKSPEDEGWLYKIAADEENSS